MSIFGTDFSADHVREFIKAKKHAEAAELAACEAARNGLKVEFNEREARPEALDRIGTLVHRQIERREKQAPLFQFPSEWLLDQGRAVTSRDRTCARRPMSDMDRGAARRPAARRGSPPDRPGRTPRGGVR
jgi:hypothetical protein